MSASAIPALVRSAYAPTDVIVPLFGVNQDQLLRFLGTASFVGPNGLLLTADHVIRDWPHRLQIVVLPDISTKYEVEKLESDSPHDLALLRVRGFAPKVPLTPLFGRAPSPIRHVTTLEYGTTEIAGTNISLHPATRLGNITRQFLELPMLGAAGVRAFELSFPALKGASGAPIIEKGTNGFYGVIVANVSRELLPCQIESVLTDDDRMLEQIKFMMPLGVAVDVNHIREMYLRHIDRQ